eukprot:Gregarina_sp_Pseudo_9__3276@NODE_345_length_3098_cov_31_728669_g325_i0_p6_GENE_NODE_345_length_3098_cov_31_728669_g325_i0NODE_345_length_3098_cov_31_728669_g325_i0_p6_ORF_typecomplete_len120_score25_54DUF2730/PF10805_8/0_095GGDEF_2/PF17853_1/0_13_NODE_345_length_3098_cov_31_728669_g325_i0129488
MDYDQKTKAFVSQVPPTESAESRLVVAALRRKLLQTRQTQGQVCVLPAPPSEEAERLDEVMASVMARISELETHVSQCPKFGTPQEQTCSTCVQARTDSTGAQSTLAILQSLSDSFAHP